MDECLMGTWSFWPQVGRNNAPVSSLELFRAYDPQMSRNDRSTVANPSYQPAAHYDRVTAAWELLLGEDLHYGVFEDPGDDLATATQRLTDAMSEAARLE
jgi:hypothetical protein